ncbi:hypothetical protein [Streptococcus cuniculi]|uniref:Uncharacterized protein n=1 Tax=Streptococcus cuniculi TaxID=1432788 RepID=A0A4Y9JDZ3_9STRE|nr:hypothetical protein [Streptococcus cuniculi]MBF0778059.1 hypothetical protein [Streptococcus cuniculi]TFU98065.1 hypothetical protein E4T82_04920 [Streptococcus cuniculi]
MKKQQTNPVGKEVPFKVLVILFMFFEIGYVVGKLLAGNQDVTAELFLLLPASRCLMMEEESKGDRK